MRKLLLPGLVAVLACLPGRALAGELQLTISGGRVTLIADAVPVRTILQEWARVGQSHIVNGEKLTGGPVTLRLIDVPEDEALDVVLRSASGYLAAPRTTAVANASRFDKIFILATSRPSAAPPMPMPQQAPQPQRQPFPADPAVQAPIVEDEDEPEEQEVPVDPDAEPQQPMTAPQPGPIQVSPQAPPGVQPPAGQQNTPVTSPRPGIIQPPPQPQPQQPRPQPPPRPIP